MGPLQQFWKEILASTGLPQKSLTSLEAFAAVFILYVLYLIFSTAILYLSFRFLETKVNWAQAFTTIIIRDIVFLPLSFFAFGMGYVLAFFIWIGLLKYRFKIEWGRAVMVALIAGILPAALTLIFLISFLGSIIFLATLLG